MAGPGYVSRTQGDGEIEKSRAKPPLHWEGMLSI